MSYLLDTNIFLELLLDQQNKDVVVKLLSDVSAADLYVSDFSICSIGIRMFKMKLFDQYNRFIEDTLISGNTRMLVVAHEELPQISEAATRFSLDFDDAYQYTVAKLNDIVIVSFDSHFDKTDRGKRDPYQIISGR